MGPALLPQILLVIKDVIIGEMGPGGGGIDVNADVLVLYRSTHRSLTNEEDRYGPPQPAPQSHVFRTGPAAPRAQHHHGGPVAMEPKVRFRLESGRSGEVRRTASDPGRVKTRTTGRQFMNFSRFSAAFGHYSLGA